MQKKIETFIIGTILVFIVFCALNIGHSWDLGMEIDRGNQRLKYILFLSSFENYMLSSRNIGDEFHPAFYSTLVSFVAKIFPKKYEFQIWQLINSIISVLAVFGIYRITSCLFNKQLGKIVFILCILNPIFFGHMAMNPKDIPVAFANIWATYFFLKYLKNQGRKSIKYTILAGLSIGFGTGMRLPFIITLVPIFIYGIIDIFFYKKLINPKFSFKKFTLDLLIVLIVAYAITISSWPHVHKNIFTEPFKIAFGINQFPLFGLPWIMLNGSLFDESNLPTFYIFINFFYKSPEFLLISYLMLIYFLFTKKTFFASHFSFLWYKIFLVLFVLAFPTIIFIIFPYRLYDGLRLFLYLIPYFCILPGLAIYYLIHNYKTLLSKFFIGIVGLFFLYYIYVFIILTPYQYTYLNVFVGNFAKAYEKFENDYWAVSIKELVKKISKQKHLVQEKTKINLAYCGLPHSLVKKELIKIENFSYDVKDFNNEKFDYVIMTNRVLIDNDNNLKTCFKKFNGEDIISVERNGLILSTLRKIN